MPLTKSQQALRGKRVADMTHAELRDWIGACKAMEAHVKPAKARRAWKRSGQEAYEELERREGPGVVEIRDELGELLLRYEVPEDENGLANANLEGVQLHGAQLAGACLQGADLYWAHLSDADLSGADLSFADLRGADLRDANFSGANLSNANLGLDNLGGGTSLQGADLREARILGAVFHGAIYSESTRLPVGLDPPAAGMRLEGAT